MYICNVLAVPGSPADLRLVYASSTSIQVEWPSPLGRFDDYEIELEKNGSVVGDDVVLLGETVHEFLNLEAGQSYTVILRSRVGTSPHLVHSHPVKLNVTCEWKHRQLIRVILFLIMNTVLLLLLLMATMMVMMLSMMTTMIMKVIFSFSGALLAVWMAQAALSGRLKLFPGTRPWLERITCER